MKSRSFSIPVVLLKTRTGYNAFSLAVDGCAASDKTIDKTLARMKEALEFHFEGLQLIKLLKKLPSERMLKRSFEEYGTDAFYATLKIAA